MFGASVSPPVQEGAKDLLTSTFMTITRQNCFLPYIQQQSHSRGSRQQGAIDLKAVPQIDHQVDS